MTAQRGDNLFAIHASILARDVRRVNPPIR
jgi:hypothetical protein